MATKSLGFGGLGIALLTLACGGEMPLGPGQLNVERTAAAPAPTGTGSSTPAPTMTTSSTSEVVVTLQPDGTAAPSQVSVASGYTILMVNNSSKYVLIQSSNCSQFSSMGLQPGVARHTMPFRPAGKTCTYFAYGDYPQQIFQGQVSIY
jgi:ribosomal protein L24E